MNRTALLETANDLLTGPRADSYGDFDQQMASIATSFNALTGNTIRPRDVGTILLLLKIKRLNTGWDTDSAVDLAGYAALIGEHYCNSTETD